jgi:CPA2 family monovalent cation:H+ antiporter-2
MPAEGQSLILAGAIISIALNPLVFHTLTPLERLLGLNSKLAARSNAPPTRWPCCPCRCRRSSSGHVVLVGYGRVGRRIADALEAGRIAVVVAEQNRELVDALRQRGIHAVAGNGGETSVLIQAHAARAAMLVIATPDTSKCAP